MFKLVKNNNFFFLINRNLNLIKHKLKEEIKTD